MPINSYHSDVAAKINLWTRCYDVYEGRESVKSKGETYLPKLSVNQETNAYLAYKERAPFFGITSETVQGLVGAALWKPPTLKMGTKLEGFVTQGMIKTAIREVIITGRYGLLVDRKPEGSAPYISAYTAKNIVNYWYQNDRLIFLVLAETNREWRSTESDEYNFENVTRYRECRLDEYGKYMQRLWVDDGKGEYVPLDPVYPQKDGSPLDFIPFVMFNPDGISSTVMNPPLIEIVDANLDHYRLWADYRHALYLTALPTVFITGISDADDIIIKIGSSQAIVVPDPQGKVDFLEYKGHGLNPIRQSIQDVETIMSHLGARILAPEKSGIEAAETLRIRQGAEVASLGSIVDAVGDGYRKAGEYACEWEGVGLDQIQTQLHKDFVADRVTPQELQAWVQTLQAGKMSFKTFFYNLHQGEMYPPDHTEEDERALIEAENMGVIE